MIEQTHCVSKGYPDIGFVLRREIQKNKEHAGYHPRCDCVHPLDIRGNIRDCVEDIGKHEEKGNQ